MWDKNEFAYNKNLVRKFRVDLFLGLHYAFLVHTLWEWVFKIWFFFYHLAKFISPFFLLPNLNLLFLERWCIWSFLLSRLASVYYLVHETETLGLFWIRAFHSLIFGWFRWCKGLVSHIISLWIVNDVALRLNLVRVEILNLFHSLAESGWILAAVAALFPLAWDGLGPLRIRIFIHHF